MPQQLSASSGNCVKGARDALNAVGCAGEPEPCGRGASAEAKALSGREPRRRRGEHLASGCGPSGCHRASSSSVPLIARRSEAWIEYRDMRLAELRSRCEAKIGSFSPRLYRPERSRRWLEGPRNKGDLYERGMRRLERRHSQERLLEKQRLAEEKQHCTFTPDIAESWPPRSPRATPRLPLDPNEWREQVARETRAATPERAAELYTAFACGRPDPRGHVTPERAADFYEQQCLWDRARVEEVDRQRRQKALATFAEEDEEEVHAVGCMVELHHKHFMKPTQASVAWALPAASTSKRSRSTPPTLQREASVDSVAAATAAAAASPSGEPPETPARRRQRPLSASEVSPGWRQARSGLPPSTPRAGRPTLHRKPRFDARVSGRPPTPRSAGEHGSIAAAALAAMPSTTTLSRGMARSR